MKQQAIAFRARKLTLEGIVTLPAGVSGPLAGVVLCHPHPLFGGSMDSPLVQALCAALDGEGVATLRFNFRGVGSSEGSFDKGAGEQEDLKAAVDTLRKWPGVNGRRVGVAGVSFGAVVALDILARAKGVEALALVAPTVGGVQRSRLDKFKGPKLVMVGDRDLLASAEELSSLVAALPTPTEYVVVAGADHSLAGYEGQVAARIAGFMAAALR